MPPSRLSCLSSSVAEFQRLGVFGFSSYLLISGHVLGSFTPDSFLFKLLLCVVRLLRCVSGRYCSFACSASPSDVPFFRDFFFALGSKPAGFFSPLQSQMSPTKPTSTAGLLSQPLASPVSLLYWIVDPNLRESVGRHAPHALFICPHQFLISVTPKKRMSPFVLSLFRFSISRRLHRFTSFARGNWTNAPAKDSPLTKSEVSLSNHATSA